MNRADVIRALVACEILAAELRRQLKAEANAELDEQKCAPTWRSPYAVVTTSLTHPKAHVVDLDVFLAYVHEAHPTEVEQIPATERIRPVWLNAFLEAVAGRGEPPCDKDGRLVPGVTIQPGGDFHTITVTPADTFKAELRAVAADIAAGRRPLALPALDTVEVLDAP